MSKEWYEETPKEFADGFTEEVEVHHSNPLLSESLPPFTSEKPCPRCKELLHWSSVNAPKVGYNTRTGKVWDVTLTRFCISCGYTERGFVNVNQEPVWTQAKEDSED